MASLAELLCVKKLEGSTGGESDLERLIRHLEQLANYIETENEEVNSQPMEIPGQMQKIRTDQVKNYAGGFVFKIDDVNRVRRFLILGTSGGTYYASEKEITMSNVKALCEIIEKGKGLMLLREIVDISLSGRAPKQDPILFALALCARYKVCDTTKRNFAALFKKKTAGKELTEEQKDAIRKEIKDMKEAEERKRKEIVGRSSEEGLEQRAPADAYLDYQRDLQKLALAAVQKVCRIPTHLFMFIKFCKKISSETGAKEKSTGWGRALRATVAQWYFNHSPEKLAMQITKYQSREGYTHRDLFRLSHICPKTSFPKEHNYWSHSEEYDFIFKYIVEGDEEKRKRKAEEKFKKSEAKRAKKSDGDKSQDTEKQMERDIQRLKIREQKTDLIRKAHPEIAVHGLENSKAVQLINAFEKVKKITEPARAVEMIKECGLVREHIPSELLNSKEIWAMLLENMPMTAMIRNIGKMASIELLDDSQGNREQVMKIVTKLTDEKALHDARIHPISVLFASSVYKSGHGFRGSLSWKTNLEIIAALEKAFLLAFKNVTPTNKRYCLALDVSGSMCAPIANSCLTCREAAAGLSMVFLRTEPKVETVAFSHNLTELPFTSKSLLNEMVSYVENMEFGSTDCALPMIWAKEKKKLFDVFIVYTDNETWFGNVHPYVALRQYREEMNVPDARLVVMGMTATEFSIADPNDAGMLDICGFDSAVPELLKEFVLGNI